MARKSAPSTLLEAARLDVKGELGKDFPTRIDLEGFGMDEEISMKAPLSPTSPLTSAVTKSTLSQPKVAVVHRVRLNRFDEKGEPSRPPRMIARRHSDDASSRPRSNSLSASGASLLEDHAARRPQSAGAIARSSSVTDAPQLRTLNCQEVAKRREDAAEWFKQSRSINRKMRSIEDTETLLSMARERRESGAAPQVRRKSKEIPLGEPATEKPPLAPEKPKRRSIDVKDLWGAKPIKRKSKKRRKRRKQSCPRKSPPACAEMSP